MNLNLGVIQKPALHPYHVLVDFGSGIPADTQGEALLWLEIYLRNLGIPAEVYKHTMADDSKLRSTMTAEQRERL